MALFYLVRHGANDWVGSGLAGRQAGIALNAEGRAQAETIATHLAPLPFDAIYSSPLERCRETAQPLAGQLALDVVAEQRLHELDLGEWQGRGFAELDPDPAWQRFNRFRSGTRPPGGGELPVQAQARMVDLIEQLAEQAPQGVFALFGHGDPLKAALVHYLGMPLDFVLRLELSVGSVSVLRVDDDGAELLAMNWRPAAPRF